MIGSAFFDSEGESYSFGGGSSWDYIYYHSSKGVYGLVNCKLFVYNDLDNYYFSLAHKNWADGNDLVLQRKVMDGKNYEIFIAANKGSKLLFWYKENDPVEKLQEKLNAEIESKKQAKQREELLLPLLFSGPYISVHFNGCGLSSISCLGYSREVLPGQEAEFARVAKLFQEKMSHLYDKYYSRFYTASGLEKPRNKAKTVVSTEEADDVVSVLCSLWSLQDKKGNNLGKSTINEAQACSVRFIDDLILCRRKC